LNIQNAYGIIYAVGVFAGGFGVVVKSLLSEIKKEDGKWQMLK